MDAFDRAGEDAFDHAASEPDAFDRAGEEPSSLGAAARAVANFFAPDMGDLTETQHVQNLANLLEPGTATREHFNAVVPPLLTTAGALALPIEAPLGAAAAGLGLMGASSAGTSLLEGGSPRDALSAAAHAINPVEHPIADTAAVALPFIGRAIGNALQSPSLSELLGYDRAVSGNAELPPGGAPQPVPPPEGPFEPTNRWQPWHEPGPSSDLPRETNIEGPQPQPWQQPGIGRSQWPSDVPWQGPAPSEPYPQRAPSLAEQLGIDAPPPKSEPPFNLAMDFNAPLPGEPVTPDALRVSRDATNLSGAQNLAAALADPSRHEGGDLLTGFRRMRDQIQGQGSQTFKNIFSSLSAADQSAVGRIMSGVSREVPSPAVTQAMDALDQWSAQIGSRAESIPGMLTRSTEGDTYGFKTLQQEPGGHFYPRINAAPQDEVLIEDALTSPNRYVDTLAHQRAPGAPSPEIVLNAQDAFNRYLGDMSTNMAASHYFGERPGFRWGAAADKAYMNMLAQGQYKDAKVFSEAMDSALNPTAATSVDRAARVATQAAGRVALGLSPLSHIKNIGNAVMRFGPANVIEGTTRYLTDPAVAELNQAGGALTGGIGQMVTRAGISPRSLVSRGTQVVQDALRGIGNAGAAPYIEDLVSRAQSGTLGQAGLRQLAELGISPEEAAQGMTADLMSRGMKAAADINMLQGHAVDHAAALFRNPLGRVLAQFQQYPASAMHMASDAVLRPIGSGLANADLSEIGLGLGRAARWIPAVAAPAAATELIRAAINGRMTSPDWNPVQDTAASTATSIAGFPADVFVNTARRGDPGFDSPLIGLLDDAVHSGSRVASGSAPGRGLAEILADLAAARDPSGTMAIARPAIRRWARTAE